MQLSSYPQVTFRMASLKDWRNPQIASNFFDIINNAGKEFLPLKYAQCHPFNLIYDPRKKDELINYWMNEEQNEKMSKGPDPMARGNIILERGKKVRYSVRWSKNAYGDFNFFLLSADINFLRITKNLNKFFDLCKEFAELLVLVKGDIVNRSIPHYSEPLNLQVIHPELHWGNFFGPPYVDLFGKEKLLSSPAYQAFEIIPNVMFVQLSEDVFSPVEDEQRLQVKNYLNPRAFVEKGLDYRIYEGKNTIIPDFDYSGVLYDPNQPIRKREIYKITRT